MPDLFPHGVQKSLQALPVIGGVQHSQMRSVVGAAGVDQGNRGGNRFLHQNAQVDVWERLIAGRGLPATRESLNHDKVGPASFQVGRLP